MKKYGKFAALIVVVVGTCLAGHCRHEGNNLLQTITELTQMATGVWETHTRGGDVEPGSIQRVGPGQLRHHPGQHPLKIAYKVPIPPDTFKDAHRPWRRQAFEGSVFEARTIQAKCASKYEVKRAWLPDGRTTSTRANRAFKRAL